jgi:hypothetical protein
MDREARAKAGIYIPRAMMRKVDGEEPILGTELVEPK